MKNAHQKTNRTWRLGKVEGRIRVWPDTKDERPNPLPEHSWIEFSLSDDQLEWIYNDLDVVVGNHFENQIRNPPDLAGKQAKELYTAVALQASNGAKARSVSPPRETDVTVFGASFLVPDESVGFWDGMLELAASTDETRRLVDQLFETLTSLQTALDTGS